MSDFYVLLFPVLTRISHKTILSILNQSNKKGGDLYLPGYKCYSWQDFPSDSISQIKERARRLYKGMDEQQVIALMRPLVVSSSFSFLLAKYRDPEIVKKEFHFNESSKDLVKINQSSYDPKHGLYLLKKYAYDQDDVGTLLNIIYISGNIIECDDDLLQETYRKIKNIYSNKNYQ